RIAAAPGYRQRLRWFERRLLLQQIRTTRSVPLLGSWHPEFFNVQCGKVVLVGRRRRNLHRSLQSGFEWRPRRLRRSHTTGRPLLLGCVEKRIFVIAITAAEATVRHTTLHRAYRNVWRGDVCTWLCIGALCAGFLAGGLVVLLAARLPTDKRTAL